MAVYGQIVEVRPMSAHLLHNTGLFTQEDPVCEVTFGDETKHTPPCWGNGSHPSWVDVFTFTRTTQDQIRFAVRDRANIGNGHEVGVGHFYFANLPGVLFEGIIKLMHHNKEAGELKVLITLIGGGQQPLTGGGYSAGYAPQSQTPLVVMSNPHHHEERHGHHGHHGHHNEHPAEVIIMPGTQQSQTYPGQQSPPQYQPYPNQQYPNQSYPGQAYPGQQYPGQQPAPGMYPAMSSPGQPYMGQQYPGQQPYPGAYYPPRY